MWSKNSGLSDDEIIQNRFTAYLKKAVSRCRRDYIMRMEKQEVSLGMSVEEIDAMFDLEQAVMRTFPIMQTMENEALLQAFEQLSERERYVVVELAVKKRTADDLALELEISYSGITAIRYRAMQKIRKAMKEGCR